uniref:Transmembrane p24 trafficking protein 9 n=1 Tax=Maylandia zebra TaxID=106582 RepID=A0A3P9CF18_9CICH
MYDKQREEYLPATQGLGMFVEVKDPDTRCFVFSLQVILSRQYGSEGRFTFTSQHLENIRSQFIPFCSDPWAKPTTTNYAEIAAKDKLTELQLRVRQLVEQVDQIQKEQNYQRYREERFRQTSESTNQRVLWWSIMRHLKSFFEAKKLV